MLIKKENEDMKLFRILAVQKEKVLVIDCIRKTMPVWIKAEQLQGFVEKEEDTGQDTGALEEYSSDVRKTIYQRYNIISAILPFVDNEAVRSELIAKMAEEHGISKQTVRKYLCEYLAAKDIRSLAPQEKKTERALTKDEKKCGKP